MLSAPDIYSVIATTDFSFMPFQTGKENEEKETDQKELLSVVLLRLREFFLIIRRLRLLLFMTSQSTNCHFYTSRTNP